MNPQKRKRAGRRRRRRRVRKRVTGSPGCPRLSVFRSLNHIYGQVVDDVSGRTLVAASSLSKEVRDKLKTGGNVGAAQAVGRLLGEKAREAGIERARFDRNGYRYHGRVKALADGAREAGLKF
jgi:large subunit ribosomal protein L18